MTEQPKRASERYELLRQLGEGGVGTVYLALDHETGERVALKKLTRMTPLSVLRFKREFRALADLRHPNLIKLYELEKGEDGWFLTMELVEGADLMKGLDDAWVGANDNAGDSARLSKMMDAFAQLARAIHAIHQVGMLHRDLKPSNVLLTRDGRVKVLDFGLVRELGQPMQLVTLQGNLSGTPAYMPPEQAREDTLTAASDWYSFGVMLYEALTGCLPIDGVTPLELIVRKQHHDAPPVPRDAAPRSLRELCAALLHREAQQRPNAEEIMRVISEYLAVRQRSIAPFTSVSEYTVTNFADPTSLSPDTQVQSASSELFGRSEEQLRLESALSSSIAEPCVTVAHVLGPSGAGKSALVQTFLATPAALSTSVDEPLLLKSRCYEREAMPFKSLDGIVDALATYMLGRNEVQVAHVLPRDVAALTALFPVFERVPAVQRLVASKNVVSRADSVGLRRRAEDGFRELLRNVAEVRPVVIWIDDLQWGDLDSTQVLNDWLKNLSEVPVLLVLSYRGDEVTTSPCLVELLSTEARIAQRARHIEINLQPLGDADIQTLCKRRIGSSASGAAIVEQIVRSAQGNPYLATQLSALARAKMARGETDLGSLSIEELVRHTGSLLSAPALQTLRVLSVAGRPLAPRVALEAADVLRNQRALIHELQTLRLVRTRNAAGASLIEVYHDGIRRSVQDSITAGDRTQIHAALLRVLLRDGTDAAWLHELSLAAGQLGRARHYGQLAAESAFANLAYERAAELYERCVQLVASNAERAELLKKLALAQVMCRRGSQAADVYIQASELAGAEERVELLRRAASHLLRSGRFEEGERVVQRVLEALQISVPGSEAALYAAIVWERTRISVLERFATPRPNVLLPQGELLIGMTYAMLALDTQCYLPLRATLFQMRATRMCFQYAEQETTARAYCMNAVLLTLSADDKAAKRVDEMLARAEALIEPDKHPVALWELYVAKSMCAMLLGRTAQVIEPARTAEAMLGSTSLMVDLGDYFYVFLVRTMLISAYQSTGRHHEAAELVRQVLVDAEATDNRCAAFQVTMARTNVEQLQSCCRDSRTRLDSERAELPRAAISILHVLHVISVLRVASITGDVAWAHEVFADFEPKYNASPLKRSVFLRYLLRVSHARFLLNEHVATKSSADPASLVSGHIKWLTREGPTPFRKVAPHRLLARLAILHGDRALATQELTKSLRAHAEIEAADEAERDRYALGLLTDGDEGAQLVAAAKSALQRIGVNDPEQELVGYYPELIGTRTPL